MDTGLNRSIGRRRWRIGLPVALFSLVMGLQSPAEAQAKAPLRSRVKAQVGVRAETQTTARAESRPAAAPDSLQVEVLEGGMSRTAASRSGARPKSAAKRASRLKSRRQGEATELRILMPDGREQIIRGFRQPNPRASKSADPAAGGLPGQGSRTASAVSQSWPAARNDAPGGIPMKVIRLRVP